MSRARPAFASQRATLERARRSASASTFPVMRKDRRISSAASRSCGEQARGVRCGRLGRFA